MERIYNLVKSWYDDNYIDEAQWQEFCTATLETFMEENEKVLKRLKNI